MFQGKRNNQETLDILIELYVIKLSALQVNSKVNCMRELIFLTLANHLPRIKLLDYGRFILYKLAGVKITGKALIFGPLIIRPIGCAGNISIGDMTFLNTHIRFGCPDDRITIGCHCLIGPNVMFETTGHSLVHNPNKGRDRYTRPITVEDEVWIGAGAIVLSGVTVGRGAVVAAGAIVTKDVPPMTLVTGVPAKVTKKIEPDASSPGDIENVNIQNDERAYTTDE